MFWNQKLKLSILHKIEIFLTQIQADTYIFYKIDTSQLKVGLQILSRFDVFGIANKMGRKQLMGALVFGIVQHFSRQNALYWCNFLKDMFFLFFSSHVFISYSNLVQASNRRVADVEKFVHDQKKQVEGSKIRHFWQTNRMSMSQQTYYHKKYYQNMKVNISLHFLVHECPGSASTRTDSLKILNIFRKYFQRIFVKKNLTTSKVD